MSGRARKLVGGGGVALAVWAAVIGAGKASAEQVCRTSTVSWVTPAPSTLYMTATHYPTFDTGLSIAPGEPGEDVTITASSYRSSDRHVEGTYPTREDDAQLNERWRLRIGGADFGQLTADVPDFVGQGAPTPWYSGEVSGSLGTGPVAPGPIVIVHASQYGYTESANSVRPQAFTLTVSYCRTLEPPTTTPAPTTAPTGTVPDSPTPPTTGETTTTAPVLPLPPGSGELAPPMTAETTIPASTPAPSAPSTTIPEAVGPPPSVPPLPDPVPLPPTSSTTTAPPATTTPTTTSSTTTTVAVAGPEPSVPTTTAQAPPHTGGRLPSTGSDVAGPLILATLSASFGVVLLLVGRRSRSATAR